MPLRMRATLAAVLLCIGFSASAPAAAPGGPMQVVKDFYAALLKAMQNGPKLGYKGRYELLAPAVDKAFDVTTMAHASVGSYWDGMSEAQRKGLVEAFRDFTVANYAHSFDDYSGEKFETESEKETPRKDVIVYSKLVKSDGDKITLNYLLRQVQDAYKIIDVYLEGSISQLAIRRSEYSALLRQSGPDGLIQAIRKKAQDLAS